MYEKNNSLIITEDGQLFDLSYQEYVTGVMCIYIQDESDCNIEQKYVFDSEYPF